MRTIPVTKGLLTYIPGLYNMFAKNKTGGTDSASYCYGVWLKHLTMLWENNMRVMPDTILEPGPGDSLGIGLAALLSGVKNYYALDVVNYINVERNLAIFDELVELFKRRAQRPTKGWPDFDKYLDANLFPSHILTEERLAASLAPERIASIRNALLNMNVESQDVTIKYVVPWGDPEVIARDSVDLILSHSVLEHVTDLESTYKAFASWLKPHGWMSHQIDFTAHYLTNQWNGHWAYSETLWKVVVGKRPYLLNRQPCSTHSTLIEKNGFEIVCQLKKNDKPGGIKRSDLAVSWQDMSEDDFTCSGTFVQAKI